MVCNYCAPGLIRRAVNPTGIWPLIPAVWLQFCWVNLFTRQYLPWQTGKYRQVIIYLSLVLILCLNMLISWNKACEGQRFVLKGKGGRWEIKEWKSRLLSALIDHHSGLNKSAFRPLHRKEAVLNNHSIWKLYKLLTFCASERYLKKIQSVYSSEKKMCGNSSWHIVSLSQRKPNPNMLINSWKEAA